MHDDSPSIEHALNTTQPKREEMVCKSKGD